jgi:exodeoxyribonuclease VII large subunit
VRGEIQKLYEKNHLYLDVVDASPDREAQPAVLKVRCWQSAWGPLKRDLRERGISLGEGTVVSFRGYVGIYRPRGEIGFAISAIDVEGLEGDLARQRAALIERLSKEGVLDANKALATPLVPLRVGLVSSPRTEGYNDFTGQLLNSGYGFQVSLVATTVQGDSAPGEVVAAIAALDAAGLDVICVVRGGGSKGDLACFDDERVARAIAAARTPVMTGIGHTGDTSVADLAAAHAAITPTKLGETLVSAVADWRERRVVRPAERLGRATDAIMEEATEYLGERRRTVMLAVRDRLGAESVHLGHVRSALSRHANHLVESEASRLSAARQLLAAYDPQRRLAQGWSIVTNASGAVVHSTKDVRVGELVSVRVADGTFETTVHDKRGG